MELLRATVLAIALTMTATSAGAQNVLEQLGGGGPVAPMREQPRVEVACKRFETTLEMRNAHPRDFYSAVPDLPPERADLAEAALQRLGGVRLVIAVDIAAVRRDLVEQGREDIRRVVRDNRLGLPSAVTIRGDVIQFRLRDGVDPAKALEAFAKLTSGPFASLASPNIAGEITANTAATFSIPDQAVEERRRRGEQASIRSVKSRLSLMAVEATLVHDLGDGRILVVIPGLRDPDDLLHIMRSRARLDFRQVDRLAEPCAPSGPPSPEYEVLRSAGQQGSLVVEKRVTVSGEDVAAAVVVRKSGTDEHAVVLRFSPRGAHRLVEFAKDNVGQSLAFVLDNEIIAAPVIIEPITGAAVMLSGGLNLEEARHLAVLAQAGTLPVPMIVVEKQVFEPKPR
jgi:preprotein translocase subunit SecD